MRGDTKGIVIGYDRHFIRQRAPDGQLKFRNNIKVHFIDRVSPTPMVMFAVKELGTRYGMSITASHNPAAYNGIKVFTEGGRDADKSVTDKLERIMAEGMEVKAFDFDKALAQGLIVINHGIYNIYIDSIISMINMDAIRSKNLRVLLDPMFGVSKTSLQTILMTARCDVI